MIYEWPSLFLVIFPFLEKKRVHRRNQWSNLNILRKWCHESTRNYKMENKLSYSMWIYSSDGYSYIPRFHRNAFPGKQCKIWNWATNASWTVRVMVELQPIVCDIANFLGHSNLKSCNKNNPYIHVLYRDPHFLIYGLFLLPGFRRNVNKKFHRIYRNDLNVWFNNLEF